MAPTPSDPEVADSSAVETVKKHTRRFVKPEVPLVVRAMRLLNVVILLTFANPIMRLLLALATIFIFAVVLTSEARGDADELWFSAVVIALIVVAWLVVEWQNARVTRVLSRLVNGSPLFGELGGMPRHLARAAIRSSKELRFDLAPEDADLLDAHMALLLKVDETRGRAAFEELMEAEGRSLDPDEVEAEWEDIWERQILGYRIGAATVRDTYAPPSYSGPIIPLRLVQVGELTGPIFVAFNAALVLLAYRALTGAGSLLTLVQVGIAFGLLITTVIYLNHVKTLHLLTVLELPSELLEPLPEELQAALNDNAGREIIPIRVSATPSYFSAIRDYFGRGVAIVMTFNALFGLLLISVPFLAGLVVISGSRSEHAAFYGRLAVAVAAIPFGIVAMHYLASFLIQRVRHFMAIVVGGIVAALVPLGLELLVSGEVPSDARAVLTAAVAGVVGSFATAFGTRLNESVSGSPQGAQPAQTPALP